MSYHKLYPLCFIHTTLSLPPHGGQPLHDTALNPLGCKLQSVRQQKTNFGMAGNFPFLEVRDFSLLSLTLNICMAFVQQSVLSVVSIFIRDIFLLSLQFPPSFVTT